MSILDDVWFEIFLHLPLDSIFKFRCISKVWLSILANPNFIDKWYKLNNSLLPWAFDHADVPDHSQDDDNNNPSRLRRKFTIAYSDSHSQFISQHQTGFSFGFLYPNFPNTSCNDEEERKILAVRVNRNSNDGTCGNECSLINFPEREMDDDFKLHHCLGESDRLICYASLKALEKTLSVWVLEEKDWYLVHKDTNFNDTLAEMVSWLIGRETTADLVTIQVLGFSPVDKNVVIFGYKKYIWAYNIRTKGYQQLSHPSFLRSNLSTPHLQYFHQSLEETLIRSWMFKYEIIESEGA